MLEISQLYKEYKSYTGNVTALKNVNLTVREGEFIAIVGKSGCGKTTLLNIIAGLLSPTGGSIRYQGEEITGRPPKFLQEYRRRHVGIILQNFSLLNDKNIFQNVELPLRIRRMEKQERKRLVTDYLEQMDILDQAEKFPNQLSGGQKQRAAIARALIYHPDIILADEPTGSLDDANAEQIVNMLGEIARNGKMVIMVTHNTELTKKCGRCVTMAEGEII